MTTDKDKDKDKVEIVFRAMIVNEICSQRHDLLSDELWDETLQKSREANVYSLVGKAIVAWMLYEEIGDYLDDRLPTQNESEWLETVLDTVYVESETEIERRNIRSLWYLLKSNNPNLETPFVVKAHVVGEALF